MFSFSAQFVPFDSPHLLLSSGSFNMALSRANCALKENACTAGYTKHSNEINAQRAIFSSTLANRFLKVLTFFWQAIAYAAYRKGYYFYSPQSSTVIKSKMAAKTISRTRTRFSPTKIRLHRRLCFVVADYFCLAIIRC